MTLLFTLILLFQQRARPDAVRMLENPNPQVVQCFARAWQAVDHGLAQHEVVVLIFRRLDGEWFCEIPPWDQNIRGIAYYRHRSSVQLILHTHSNIDRPDPSNTDKHSARRWMCPLGTLSARGLWVYDPATKETTLIREGTTWLHDRTNKRGDAGGPADPNAHAPPKTPTLKSGSATRGPLLQLRLRRPAESGWVPFHRSHRPQRGSSLLCRVGRRDTTLLRRAVGLSRAHSMA